MKRAATTLLATSLLCVGCTEQTEAPTSVAQTATHSKATLALSYRPSDAPTDKMIAEAQERVEARSSDVDSILNLAVLLMRRRRETSKPALMLYAKDAVRAALAIDAKNTMAMTLRGMIHQYDHEFEAARDAAETIIKLDPETSLAHLLLGDAELELGDYEGAIEAYQNAIDLRPDLRSYNRAAHITWLHGDAEQAIELIDMAIDSGSMRDPESSAWCYVDLGDIYRHAGKPAQGLAAAEKALALMPNYMPALVLKARSLAAQSKVAEAVAAYEASFERLPTVDTLVEQAELLNASSRAGGAERLADAAALSREDPRPLAHYYARHRINTKEAVRLAEAELDARKNIYAYDTYALALIRAGKLDEAKSALDKASALGTPLAELELHRALLQSSRGYRKEASKSLASALTLNPLVDPHLVAELRKVL